MRRPISTSSGLDTFGNSSARMILWRFSPTASAALTKSRSTTCSAAPRITRATRGAVVMPTASTRSHSLGPSAATSSSAKRICGKARKMSATRISNSSTKPPAYAAVRPISTPSVTPRIVESTASPSTVRPPFRNRLRTSRPSRSVPSSAWLDGPLLSIPANAVGEWGANAGPTSAIRTISVTMPSPMRVRLSRRAERSTVSSWRWRSGATAPAGDSRATAWVLTVPPSAASASAAPSTRRRGS